MKNKEYTHLRAQVQKVEEKILTITGKNVEFNMEWTRSQRKCEQIEKMIWKRKRLLDKMFVATLEEVKRMEQVNSRLYDLTQKMRAMMSIRFSSTTCIRRLIFSRNCSLWATRWVS